MVYANGASLCTVTFLLQKKTSGAILGSAWVTGNVLGKGVHSDGAGHIERWDTGERPVDRVRAHKTLDPDPQIWWIARISSLPSADRLHLHAGPQRVIHAIQSLAACRGVLQYAPVEGQATRFGGLSDTLYALAPGWGKRNIPKVPIGIFTSTFRVLVCLI